MLVKPKSCRATIPYRSLQNFDIKGRVQEADSQMADDPYHEFEEALTDILCEEEFDIIRRRRLVKARERISDHDPRYVLAAKRAAQLAYEKWRNR